MANYCPHCHAPSSSTQREDEDERLDAEDRARRAVVTAKDRSEGIIYGRIYERYKEEDVRNITNISFLHDLLWGITPNAQPIYDWEWDWLYSMTTAIENRIVELKK